LRRRGRDEENSSSHISNSGVLAVSVGYVLFSQPAPEGNGSKTVYDYERLEPFPFDIQDGK